MRFISQLSVAFSLVLILGCKDKELIVPKPLGLFSGAIFIGCDGGPYELNIDSLIALCTTEVDFDQPLDSIMSPCLYDELGPRLSVNFDLQLERSLSSNVITLSSTKGDLVVENISLVLQGHEYMTGEYPYYDGYQLIWPNRTLRVHVLNKWIGGCYLDLILWEVLIK